jgi:adenosylcobinamide kinase/adenosylcobinamide-phosphate guanylyltransferase
MTILFIGGVKSGKSCLAEKRALELCDKPIYLATTEIMDDEMTLRVQRHKEQRDPRFTLIEEGVDIAHVVQKQDSLVLVECMSMWLNNMLYYEFSQDKILLEVEKLLSLKGDRVFVLNDVGSGIIPIDALSRKFIDLSGLIAQKLAQQADEVYHCIAGIGTRIK